MPFQATAFRLFCDHNFTDRNKYKNEIAAICLENPGLDRRGENMKSALGVQALRRRLVYNS